MQFLKSTFSKIPKHAKFDYEPRYSKAEQENDEKDGEKKRISFRREGMPFSDSKIISGKLRRSSIAYRKKEVHKTKMRMYALIGAIVALLIILFQNL